MDWKKYFCPLCGNDFNENDDVVVCPDCGTPHHRDCWNQLNHCFNENLHSTGDSLECTYKKAEPVQSEPFNEAQPEINPDTPRYYGSFGGFGNINPFEANENRDSYSTATTYINGKPAVYYEIAVKKNQNYYIPRFMMLDKSIKSPGSWNFCAFLFPFAWSLYRKMYKLAAVVFAIYIAISGMLVYSVFSDAELFESFNVCYEEDPEFMNDIIAYTGGESGTELTANQKEFYSHYENYSIPGYIYWSIMIINYACKIFVGLKANKFYLQKITKNIEAGERLGIQGDLLKNYVYRRNGVLPLIVVAAIAFLEWTMIGV